MIRDLSRPFPSRYGVPVLARVETGIFITRYFTHCLECTFCQNWCCSWGVDVDAENVRRILARAEEIEVYTGIPRAQWFAGEQADDEFPGGRCTRTQTTDGACVFLSRAGRGCLLHSFANANGLDYHEIKPMVSSLFPLTFAYGALLPSAEVQDGTLVCLDRGPTLYGGIRGELAYYFGGQLIAELDELEAIVRAQAGLDSAAHRDGEAKSP